MWMVTSNVFKTVEYIYGDNDPVNKQECIGHYQKRMGCRLQKLRSKEHLGGKKGGLTNSIIDRLQNYFGIALHQNMAIKGHERCYYGLSVSCIKLSPVFLGKPRTVGTFTKKTRTMVLIPYKVREELPLNVRRLVFPI